ncbi:amino acid adenylation domain-containing protein, partial [Amycolatopsis sp. NPDC059021]|uniref:amino acid adenylation domain-containing protein n=1 Tax=Amycolatopsis sp. NPDC059021 TaxID=3346704 RepID=UPI00366BFEEA
YLSAAMIHLRDNTLLTEPRGGGGRHPPPRGPPARGALVASGRPAAPLDWHPDRIDRAFARQAAERPDATAVSYEDESLTYAQLAERAARLAAGLVARGVHPGDRVGVCLDRGLDLVVTLLAVLQADAVYVPMDPVYPADRLAYTVEDADLRLVVTELDGFPAAEGVSLLSPAELSHCDTPLPAPARGAGDAAYVIYTSGSTGRPKGVVVPHRNVVALLAATSGDFGLGQDDTWTLFHSSAFDFSVWEIWGALLTGGHLVVVPYWVSRSPAEFRALLASRGVTVLSQTPSAFTQLMAVDQAPLAALPLRLVVFGGEALDQSRLRAWFDRYPETRCRLVNMFGITETTVHVTAQTITRRDALSGSRSVGSALPGWHVYVLDERGRPLPAGIPGEIYVGGEGVAVGYLGRPGLTAQRFLPDPFTGGRVYRSGDRGRLLPDGRLEHLGRLDDQVKIRGFRIELGEIRGVLQQCSGVRDAAVVVGGRSAGDTAALRLDAYVVLDGVTTSAVRQWAAKMLPGYMLPATLTTLPRLPLTANGKLDAARLPEPELDRGTAAPRPAAPAAAGDLGGALLEIWEAVLGKSIGPDDTFFNLGGNSLYAVRIAAAMQERGLPALSLRQLYLNPTVRRLTSALRNDDRG